MIVVWGFHEITLDYEDGVVMGPDGSSNTLEAVCLKP
jgi:hypothetical protein